MIEFFQDIFKIYPVMREQFLFGTWEEKNAARSYFQKILENMRQIKSIGCFSEKESAMYHDILHIFNEHRGWFNYA